MAYAAVNDVATRLGRLITDPLEIAQVQAWLDDIEDIIRTEFARAGLDLTAQVTAGDPSLATVVRVEAEAVIRRMQNPLGLTSVTRSVDDASVTERRENHTDTGAWLTDVDWLALLGSNSDTGAFSTSPGFEPDGSDDRAWTTTTDYYVPVP